MALEIMGLTLALLCGRSMARSGGPGGRSRSIRPADQDGAKALSDAVRGHWLVEVMHHRRDVTLAEDKSRTEIRPLSRGMSTLRTLAVNSLKRLKPKSMAAQIDELADRFKLLIQFMTQQLVL